MGRYFTRTVKPTITASKQTSAFADGDLLFDWTRIKLPRGGNKLTGVTALIKKTDGTTNNEKPFFLLYAKSIGGTAPSSLGSINATANGTGYYNNIIGKSVFLAADYTGNKIDNLHVAGLNAGGSAADIPNIVLEGESITTTDFSSDYIWVAGIAEGTFDFSTEVTLDDNVDVSGLSVPTITTLDNTACNIAFAVGDILHVQDDIILGEVASVDANNITFKADGSKQYHAGGEVLHTNPASFAAWQTQNGAGAAGDLANNDEVYNIHPMTFIFSFEASR